MKTIEDVYDQKLALQKPVKYWRAKEQYHSVRATRFGVVTLSVLISIAISLGFLIANVVGNLKPEENPKHWQIGLLLVVAFFSIWLIRILVRLFLSHHHLATDAGERRTMILTYLSIAREGTAFAPEDKSLILQHIFRSASDGLVKDDATPTTPLSYFSGEKQ